MLLFRKFYGTDTETTNCLKRIYNSAIEFDYTHAEIETRISIMKTAKIFIYFYEATASVREYYKLNWFRPGNLQMSSGNKLRTPFSELFPPLKTDN